MKPARIRTRIKPRVVMLPYLMLMGFVAAATSLGAFGFPWWWPAVPGLLAGFWKRETPLRTFVVSFCGAGLAWAGVAAACDARNDGILAARIAPLFHLHGSVGLLFATAGIGGMTAGLGALAGDHFHRFWRSLMLALAAEDVLIPPDEDK